MKTQFTINRSEKNTSTRRNRNHKNMQTTTNGYFYEQQNLQLQQPRKCSEFFLKQLFWKQKMFGIVSKTLTCKTKHQCNPNETISDSF